MDIQSKLHTHLTPHGPNGGAFNKVVNFNSPNRWQADGQDTSNGGVGDGLRGYDKDNGTYRGTNNLGADTTGGTTISGDYLILNLPIARRFSGLKLYHWMNISENANEGRKTMASRLENLWSKRLQVLGSLL